RHERVLRRRPARRPAAAHRRGNRRPLLHPGPDRTAPRGPGCRGPRREHGRDTRAVGHADPLPADARTRRRGMGHAAAVGPGMTMRRPSLRFVRPALYAALSCLVAATPAAAQRTHVLIVSGISGEPRFAEQWSAWSGSLATGLREAGVAAADIVRLDERGGDGAAAADDQVLLVFFGHGSGDGGATRINLPGPDLAASELAAMLTSFPTQRVIIVNAASASGGFVEPLAGANRVIITATRSAGQ